MSSASSVPNATVVGNSFITQYYTMLHTRPEDLYKFYKAESTFDHGKEGEERQAPAVGVEAIKSRIEEAKFHNCTVELSLIDCQSSHQGAVLVSVVGILSNRSEVPRRFTQTFVLAPQDPQGYFVNNDIMRYLVDYSLESPSHGAQSPIGSPKHSPVKVVSPLLPPSSPLGLNGKQQQPPSPLHKSHSPKSSPAKTPEANGNVTSAAPPALQLNEPAAQKPAKPAPAPAQSNEKPSTFLAALVGGSEPPKPQPVARPTQQKAQLNKAKPDGESKSQQQNQKLQQEPEEEVDDGCSLWVGQLPQETTTEELAILFATVGPVKDVRLTKAKGFGFVEFESAESVQAALREGETSPFNLHGADLRIQEKKTTPRQSSGKGGRSNRGGFREAGRGRPARGRGGGEGGRGGRQGPKRGGGN